MCKTVKNKNKQDILHLLASHLLISKRLEVACFTYIFICLILKKRIYLNTKKEISKDKKGSIKRQKGKFQKTKKEVSKDKKGGIKRQKRRYQKTKKEVSKDKKGSIKRQKKEISRPHFSF